MIPKFRSYFKILGYEMSPMCVCQAVSGEKQ